MSRLALAAALTLLTASTAAAAQRVVQTRRGDMPLVVKVEGTVVPAELARVKADFEGRFEEPRVTTYTWARAKRPMAYLASHEMAAMLDSQTSTIEDVAKQRWERVYRLEPLVCPEDCFVLRVFARPRQWIKPRGLIFEVAQKLQLVGRVRPEQAHLVRDGMFVEFWAKDQPDKKQKIKIQRYVLDIQADKVSPGGSFAVNLTPDKFLPPGTAWEGKIVPMTRKGVIIAPTDALIHYNGEIFLPVRVSTGITTPDLTEIRAGVDDKRPLLILDDARMAGLERHAPKVDVGALEERLREQKQAERQAADQRDAERREQARQAEERAPTPAESAPTTPLRREQPRYVPPRERSGALTDPDATFSESPE